MSIFVGEPIISILGWRGTYSCKGLFKNTANYFNQYASLKSIGYKTPLEKISGYLKHKPIFTPIGVGYYLGGQFVNDYGVINMAIEGDLEKMGLLMLVDVVMEDNTTALIWLNKKKIKGFIYFDQGNVTHAMITDKSHGEEQVTLGREAIFDMLTWTKARYAIELNIEAPSRSMSESWKDLLEAAKNSSNAAETDSAQQTPEQPESAVRLPKNTTELSVVDIGDKQLEQDANMPIYCEEIHSILHLLTQKNRNLTNVALVDDNGFIMDSVMSDTVDENRLAAVSAGFIMLATRSAAQLKQGKINQALIQADQGNIYVMRAGEKASFVALTPTDVNLGMVMMLCTDAVQHIARINDGTLGFDDAKPVELNVSGMRRFTGM